MTGEANLLQRLTTLEARLDELESRQQITELLAQLSRALDWLDRDLLEPLLFDDAEIDYGFFQGTGKDFKPVIFEVERNFGRRWHLTAQPRIAMDGRDAAEVESYQLSIGAPAETRGESAALSMFYGLYVDRLERRDGRWGIARRTHVLLAGTRIDEMPITGALESLNRIGHASPAHPLYRKLS